MQKLTKTGSYKSFLIKNHSNELINIFLNNPKSYESLQIYHHVVVDGYDEIFKEDNQLMIDKYKIEEFFTV